MDYNAMIEEYTRTEAGLRERAVLLRQQLKVLSLAEHDDLRRRLALIQEELYDVALVQLELRRRQREEWEEAALC